MNEIELADAVDNILIQMLVDGAPDEDASWTEHFAWSDMMVAEGLEDQL